MTPWGVTIIAVGWLVVLGALALPLVLARWIISALVLLCWYLVMRALKRKGTDE